MARSTPTSRRSPSILVTDARQDAHTAPFVHRRLNKVSVDRLLSHTSEVPSAQRRAPLRAPHRFRASNHADQNEQTEQTEQTEHERAPLLPKQAGVLTKSLPSRTSKQSQRLVLIPDAESPQISADQTHDEVQGQRMRVTSYLIAGGVLLRPAAKFLKSRHKARVRLYDEALFADYLLPLLPGDDVEYRIRSSVGDNKTMERMIDISEQDDHHFEYFSANGETDPSEPNAFSPVRENGFEQKTANEPEMEDLVLYDHAELFIFNYGVVVFWNFSEQQEKQVLADLCLGEPMLVDPCSDQEIESEELQFTYNAHAQPSVCNDLIVVNNGSHILKLAMSHAMAQSTVLCGFEGRMQADLRDVEQIPKTLALTGKLGLNREELLRISGRLYKLRVDVNLSSNVLDIPDFFWDSEPSLFPLFSALREYLEIDKRVLLINEKQQVFLELTSVLSDSIAEFNMDKITVIVIWLIGLSIVVSLGEIITRYYLIRNGPR